MVLCDGGLVINLAASAMMEGICCIHSMQKEQDVKKEHHKALRKAIHVEWERQRLLDLQKREQMLRSEQTNAASQERRRLLMMTKLQASSAANNSSSSSLRTLDATSPTKGSRNNSGHRSVGFLAQEDSSLAFVKSPSTVMSQARRVRSMPVYGSPKTTRKTRRVPVVKTHARRPSETSQMSSMSLMDQLDEDDDDSFASVTLQ